VPTQKVTSQPDRDEGVESTELALSRHLKREREGREKEGKPEALKKGKHERRDFFAEAAAFTPIVSAQDRSGRTFLVGAGDRGDARMLFTKRDTVAGRSLRLAVDHLKQVAPLPDRSRFLDTGAETGIAAVLAIQEHGFNSAIALEPNPGMYRLLSANRALNDLEDRIETIHIEPKSGTTLVLRYGKRGWCDYQSASGEDAAAAVSKGKAVEVRSASLDELVAHGSLDPSSAALVRISVRPDPAAVLEGMRESVPNVAILLELDQRVLGDRASVTKLDTAIAEHFSRGVAMMGLSEEGPVPQEGIAELAGAGDVKTASVLALGR